MKILRKIGSALVIIGLLTSCATYEYIPCEINVEYVDISDKEGDTLYQDIRYPEIEITGNDDLVNAIIELNKTLKSNAEKFKEENIEEVRIEKNEYNHDGNYEYYCPLTVMQNDENYLSIQETGYYYLMGAHGSTIIKGYNFDAKTGKRLTIFDLIKNKNDFKEFFINYLNTEYEYKEDLFPEYEETIDKYLSGEYELEFVIEEDNLKVIFQQYDLVPYAFGAPSIIIDKKLTNLK